MNTKNKAQQDKYLSLSADEFVWEEVGDSPVDCLVVPPIVNLFEELSGIQSVGFGRGNGAFTHLLHQQGFNVEGFDGSAPSVEIARNNYPEIQFSQLDLVSGKVPEHHSQQFDAVVPIEVIEYLLLPRMPSRASIKIVEIADFDNPISWLLEKFGYRSH